MLLEDADILDLQIFTSQVSVKIFKCFCVFENIFFQFYLNGSSIKAELPEKFAEILNNVRTLLISGRQLAKEAKLWLLLALEVSNNRFGALPIEVTKFYEDQLGATAMASFQVGCILVFI